MSDKENPRLFHLENVVTVGLGIIAAVGLYNTWGIPASSFEPLGAGFFPRIICMIMIALVLLLVFLDTIKLSGARQKDISQDHEQVLVRARALDCFIVFIIVCLFAFLMTQKIMPFYLLSLFFFILTMSILFRNIKMLPVYAVTGLAVGYAIQLAGSNFFYLDI